jgi:hypothetical protein
MLRGSEGRLDGLAIAAVAFIATMVIHAADHQIRGRDYTDEVMAGGFVLFALGALVLTVVLRRHPRAAQIAVFVGFYTAVAVIAAHVLPHWSAFSDTYSEKDLGIVSWLAMASEVVAAFVLGLVGLRRVRELPPAAAAA